MKLFYTKAELPPSQILRNVSYDSVAPGDPRRQLDLYLPGGTNWPVLVFIHGGGWTWGDRLQRFGGEDVYGNVGRFFALQGFGVAVISYRLVWTVAWDTQARDVARAVAWVQRELSAHGARRDAVFVMGHSAGAQLAMRVAVEREWLDEAGGRAAALCGVVAVSGAGYDFTDEVTYELDRDHEYFPQRFAYRDDGKGNPREDEDLYALRASWRQAASPSAALSPDAPPFLTLLAEQDYPSIHRQSRLVDERLRALGLSAGFVLVPEVDHRRIVLELSRADRTATPAILQFLRDTPCPRSVSPRSP